MAENGYGAPMAGHIGRIPNYGRTQVNPMGNVEPPACIQNAMMTKDKKPFTYTPGGLDLSQIRTPSMARRMARQKSQEEHEQAHGHHMNNGGNNYRPQGGPGGPGGPMPPPPPPMNIPAPPPPPPIVIQVPGSKSPKPVPLGERPEIVIPENPIGMLRKTNSPYHWEVEKAEMQRVGAVPKFQEKVPSPLTVKMPPSSFSQQQPQTYTPQSNNFQRHPESPIHRPEAQYMHQKSASPLTNGSPPTREILQRQDSQFNKSPQPFGGQSPLSNSSTPYSPTPNNNWRQPEKRDSPAVSSPQQSPQIGRGPFSPNTQQYSPKIQNQSPSAQSGPAFHTIPRAGQRKQENSQNNNVVYNNVNQVKSQSPPDVAPWRSNTLNRHQREPEPQQVSVNNNQEYVPPWKANEPSTNAENSYIPAWHAKQDNKQQQYQPPWVSQDTNNNKVQESAPWRSQNMDRAPSSPPRNQAPEQPRYQSTMSIPVTARKQNNQPNYNSQPSYNNQPNYNSQSSYNNQPSYNSTPVTPQKEAVYVTEEPVYYCPGPESPKSIPPWVKTQKEKTKTPPPEWVQKPLQGRQSASRELATPPRENEPEWVKKSNELQRGAREVVSPPKYQQGVPPTWSTRPSDNRRSLPKDNGPSSPSGRVIPIQMEVSSTEIRDNNRQGHPQPQLRITIGMNADPDQARAPFSPPTQRIMRVLSPQLVRMDEGPQHDLPTLTRPFPTQGNQPKTRIIPIQIEGGNSGANKSVFYHKFTQEGPPRQSKAFKVLQIITGTQESDNIQNIESRHGFTDL